MAREVEFGNEIGKLHVLDIEIGVIVRNSLEEVDRPLASDITRNDYALDINPFQH